MQSHSPDPALVDNKGVKEEVSQKANTTDTDSYPCSPLDQAIFLHLQESLWDTQSTGSPQLNLPQILTYKQ